MTSIDNVDDLFALAEGRERAADRHGANAARWSGLAAGLRRNGRVEEAEIYEIMTRAAERCEATALDAARDARRRARRMETSAGLMGELAFERAFAR